MKTRRFLSTVLAVVMLVSLVLTGTTALAAEENPYEPTEFVTHEGVTFGRATSAYATSVKNAWTGEETTVDPAGMPLFDGNEEHLAAYVDLLLTELGEEDWPILASGSSAGAVGTYSDDPEKTWVMMRSSSSGPQSIQGAPGETDFSTVLYQSQSWDRELVGEIGKVIGAEVKSGLKNTEVSFATSNGLSQVDTRLNPLAGRYDEGYGEDAYLNGQFIDISAKGHNGYDYDEDLGLYVMAVTQTRHPFVYNSEWFRGAGSYNISARGFYEYNGRAAATAIKNGSIQTYMSAYGRINGVPATVAFYNEWAQEIAKYPMVSTPDAGADEPLMVNTGNYGQFTNGYDEAYVPSADYKAAYMAAANHRPSGGADRLTEAIENGLLGLTYEDIRTMAEAYIVVRVRAGLFDVRDANGLSKYYPFNDIASNGTAKLDHTSEYSKDVALRNAQEGIVLLKNEGGALPLSKSDNGTVYGEYAKVVSDGIYNTALVEDYSTYGDNAGLNGLEGINAVRGSDIDWEDGLNTVTIQVGDAGYLYVDADDESGKLQVKAELDEADMGFYFAISDHGQGASSIYSYGNGKWVQALLSNPSINFNSIVGAPANKLTFAFMPPQAQTGMLAGMGITAETPFVSATCTATYKNTPIPGGDLPKWESNMPYMLALEPAENEGEYYIHVGSESQYVTFMTGVPAVQSKYFGYYLEDKDGTVVMGGAEFLADAGTGVGIKYFQDAADKTPFTFKINEVTAPGKASSVAANVADDDYAIIFVGQRYWGLQGEGTDREDLDIGASQIQSALNIAQAYKAAGKKTVVAVYANAPVNLDALQQSADVDAIVLGGYGGQYAGYALGQVIYGDYAPTGRLVSTWYKDLALFPAIDEYSVNAAANYLPNFKNTILEGMDTISLDSIDDRITVDMTNADVINTGMTYQYISDADAAAHVLYPFGYGLSYSAFELSNVKVPASATDSFTVEVTVKNTGSVATSDVVQVYMSNPASAYGSAAPLKTLVGFEKVALAAGESKVVSIPVDTMDAALWDVNAEEYVVEKGTYNVFVCHDASLKDAQKASVKLTGGDMAAFPLNKEANIWEHSFNYSNANFDEYSKIQTGASCKAEGVNDDTFAVTAKAAGAWTVIPKVNTSKLTKAAITAGAPTGVSGTVELHLDSPTGTKIATFYVISTGEVTKELVSNDNVTEKATIKEQGYNTLEVDASAVKGIHDLYVVFGAKDLRVGTLLLTSTPGSSAITPSDPNRPGAGGSNTPSTPTEEPGTTDDPATPSEETVKPASEIFTDVAAGSWYEDAVSFVVDKDLFAGVGNDLFAPDAQMTRAMLMTVLARLDGKDTSTGATWDAVGMAWAKENEISDGTNPSANVTRQELATMLCRYAKYKGLDVSLDEDTNHLSWKDVLDISDWAADAMFWAVDNGIITGKPGSLLDPLGFASRAEVATMIMRFATLDK